MNSFLNLHGQNRSEENKYKKLTFQATMLPETQIRESPFEQPETNHKKQAKTSMSAFFGENAAKLIKIGAVGYLAGAGLQLLGRMPISPLVNQYIQTAQPSDIPALVEESSTIENVQAEQAIATLGDILKTGGWTAMSMGALGLKGCQFASFGKEKNQPTVTLGGLALIADTPLMILLPQSVLPKAAMYISIAAINAGYANFARNEHIEKDGTPREFNFDYLFKPEVYKKTFEFLKNPSDKKAQQETLKNLNKTKEMAKFIIEDEGKIIHSPAKLIKQSYDFLRGERKKLPIAVDIQDIQDPKSMSKTFRELKRWSSLITQVAGGMLMYTAVIPCSDISVAGNIAATLGTVIDCGGVWVKSSEANPHEKVLLISGILTKAAGTIFAGVNNDALVMRNVGDSILLSELYAKQAKSAV
jgi:hypothetical protein